MARKWLSLCVSGMSVVVMHYAFATVVSLWISTSMLSVTIIIAAILFLWIVCGRWWRNCLGLSASAPSFVFLNVLLLWGVYAFLFLGVVGRAMDTTFNVQCIVLIVGLWRMLFSDPGYVRYENMSVEGINQTASIEMETDQAFIGDHSAAMAINIQTSHDQELSTRVRYCRKCRAYIDRFDHHCPAFGNCVGRRNHRLFIFLLIAFICTEMSYIWCSISCFPNFKILWEQKSQASNFLPWTISTTGFAVIQVFWQVPFLFWHLYCICVNVTTDEWVNWKKYPEFQLEIPPEPGRPFHGTAFRNPYNKGIRSNIRAFLTSQA